MIVVWSNSALSLKPRACLKSTSLFGLHWEPKIWISRLMRFPAMLGTALSVLRHVSQRGIVQTSFDGYIARHVAIVSGTTAITFDHGRTVDEESLLRCLLDSQSWLAQNFPNHHGCHWSAPSQRIVNVFEGHTEEITIAGFQALDKLHDTVEASCYGKGCKDREQNSLIESKPHRKL